MSRKNVEIVRHIFGGWAAGDFSGAADALDPHVTVVVRQPFVEFGVFHGPDGVRDYFLGFFAQFEKLTMQAQQLRTAGDTVLVQVLQRGEGKVSGLSAEISFFMLFTFRGGQIVRIEAVVEEGEALEAAGLSE